MGGRRRITPARGGGRKGEKCGEKRWRHGDQCTNRGRNHARNCGKTGRGGTYSSQGRGCGSAGGGETYGECGGRDGRKSRGERVHEPADETAEEKERRRKGKCVISDWAEAGGPGPISSGSGSCGPGKEGGPPADQMGQQSSDDADSRAGPAQEAGKNKDKPILISDGSQQDVDLGGEGGKECMEEDGDCKPLQILKEVGKGEVRRTMLERGRQGGEGGREGLSVDHVGEERRQGSTRGRMRTSEGSRGSTASVPPGFQRRQKSQQGTSSPFGKLQRGGFKFLNRSASAASSGPKQSSPTPSKKNRPIAAMPSKEIMEVASNVGVEKPLTEEQIGRIKALETDRSSS